MILFFKLFYLVGDSLGFSPAERQYQWGFLLFGNTRNCERGYLAELMAYSDAVKY